MSEDQATEQGALLTLSRMVKAEPNSTGRSGRSSENRTELKRGGWQRIVATWQPPGTAPGPARKCPALTPACLYHAVSHLGVLGHVSLVGFS